MPNDEVKVIIKTEGLEPVAELADQLKALIEQSRNVTSELEKALDTLRIKFE